MTNTSPLNQIIIQAFTHPDRVPMGTASDYVNSLSGQSEVYSMIRLDADRLLSLQQRLYLFKFMRHMWAQLISPSITSGRSSDLLENGSNDPVFNSVVNTIVNTITSNPVCLTPTTAGLIRKSMLASHQYVPEDSADSSSPSLRLKSDPSNPWVIALTDIFTTSLNDGYKTKQMQDLWKNWFKDSLKDSSSTTDLVGSILSSSITMYEEAIQNIQQLGITDHLSDNIKAISQHTHWTADQQGMLHLVLSTRHAAANWLSSLVTPFNILFSAYDKDEAQCFQALDACYGWAHGTSRGVFEEQGWLDQVGLLSTNRGKHFHWILGVYSSSMTIVKPEQLAVLLNNHLDEKSLFTALADCGFCAFDAQPLSAEDFPHIGRDMDNLLAVLSTPKSMKVLIAGRAGTGKSAVLATALSVLNKSAVELDRNDESKYESFDHRVASLRKALPMLGHPILVLDHMETEISANDNSVQRALTGPSSNKASSTEIWITTAVKDVPERALDAFDLVINIPPLPFKSRQTLATKLFADPAIAERVAKTCTTPGEITRLAEWSALTHQTDWEQLSQKIASLQQAIYKAKDRHGDLPVTLFQASDNQKGFETVIGCPQIVKQAQRLIQGYKQPEAYKNLGARPPKGVLLKGGPGLGKTHLARAMASEASVPLLVADSAALAECPDLISKVFDEARRQAPCILFLDELDAIGTTAKTFDNSPPDPKRQAILNRLLTELDGFASLDSVMVIGATHRSDMLDDALIRSGRLGWSIAFSPPDRASREELWKFYTSHMALTPDTDWARLARTSSGMSPADIAESANIAAMEAVMGESRAVTTTHLVAAIDQVLWGHVGDDRPLADSEIYRTAVHEAGHALLAWQHNKDIERISVRPMSGTLGHVRMIRDEDQLHLSQDDLAADVAISFGGLLAEEVVFGCHSTGASSDLSSIRQTVAHMMRQEGMAENAFPMGINWFSATETLKSACEKHEETWVTNIKHEALAFINDHKPVIKALAKELVKVRELNGTEFDQWLRKTGLNKSPMAVLPEKDQPSPSSVSEFPPPGQIPSVFTPQPANDPEPQDLAVAACGASAETHPTKPKP